MPLHAHANIHQRMTEAMDNASLKPLHWKIWWLSAMGIFLDGFDLFIIGVAMPLIISMFSPPAHMVGLIGASALLGAVLGSAVGGPLADKLGRRSLYIANIIIFIALSIATAFSWNVNSLIALRFLLGVGIGSDYP
ncbi:MAG: MFS transporter, partial [Candidatus Omnitrophica bacterium]|nr:MFS transporter [Candidatus Omnitrophota bacterium]